MRSVLLFASLCIAGASASQSECVTRADFDSLAADLRAYIDNRLGEIAQAARTTSNGQQSRKLLANSATRSRLIMASTEAEITMGSVGNSVTINVMSSSPGTLNINADVNLGAHRLYGDGSGLDLSANTQIQNLQAAVTALATNAPPTPYSSGVPTAYLSGVPTGVPTALPTTGVPTAVSPTQPIGPTTALGVGQSTQFAFTGNYVTYVVPSTGTYRIAARGAQGGQTYTDCVGGLGAAMEGTFSLTAGQKLILLVGQSPGASGLFSVGGGGTFVATGETYSVATPLIVAGGGGGCYQSGTGGPGLAVESATTTGAAGQGAPPVKCGGGGGGFYSSGGASTGNTSPQYPTAGGASFREGGLGGHINAYYGGSAYQSPMFGGAGMADYVNSCNLKAGPGGGYSGGKGVDSFDVITVGNGGGSFNSGTSAANQSGVNTGHGSVTITRNT